MSPVNTPLRIVVADGDPDVSRFWRKTLTRLGHHVTVAHDGAHLAELCRLHAPDMVVTSVLPPGSAAGPADVPPAFPVVLASHTLDPEAVGRALGGEVVAILVPPAGDEQLAASVTVAMRVWRKLRASCAEAAELRQALRERKAR